MCKAGLNWRICFGVLLLLTASVVPAAPDKTSGPTILRVSGKLKQGNSLKILGSGFGSGGNLMIFDDFETGKEGTPIAMGLGSARLGGWYTTMGRVGYCSTHAVSGNMSLRADLQFDATSSAWCRFPERTREVFASWWVRIPKVLPGQGPPRRICWKHVWVTGKTIRDDAVWVMFGSSSASLLIGGGSNPVYTHTNWSLENRFHHGDWLRMAFYLKGGLTDGQYELELMNPAGFRETFSAKGRTWGGYQGRDGHGMPMQYESIGFNAFGRRTPNCYPNYDDCYAAVGPNCRARVEMGDKPEYANCKKLAICGVTRWKTDSAEAIVNLGNLDTRNGLYLFVVDAKGAPSKGYPIGARKKAPRQVRPAVRVSPTSTTNPSTTKP